MKWLAKASLIVTMILAIASPGLALGIGGRDRAMAGAYTALVNNSTAAYYNPAGIVNSGIGGFNVALGTSNINQFMDIYNAASQGTSFIKNNFNNNITFTGDFNGIIGLNMAKMGFTIIPKGSATGSKPAGSQSFNYGAAVTEDIGYTFGNEFKTPILPIGNLAIGATAKYILGQRFDVTYAAGGGGTAAGNEDSLSASGFGLDIGAQAKLTPFVSAGVAMRDLFATESWSGTRQPKTMDATGTTTNAGAATPRSFSTPRGSVLAFGVAGSIPGFGTTGAAEWTTGNTGSGFAIGAEQPILPAGVLVARVGYGVSNTTNLLSFGLGFNVGPAHIDAAYGFDSKQNNASQAVLEASFGL
jgi:hypothetical protein